MAKKQNQNQKRTKSTTKNPAKTAAKKNNNKTLIIVAIILAVAIIASAILVVYAFPDEFRGLFSSDPPPQNVYPNNFDADNIGLEVHFIDVGQGDATLIIFDNGKTMLIDAGSDTPAQVRQDFMAYLNEVMVKDYIDYLIITHPHADHINLLYHTNHTANPSVLSVFNVKNIYKNNFQNNSATETNVYNRILYLEQNHGTVVNRVGAQGGTFNVYGENYSVDIFAPGHGRFGNLNDMSIFVVIEYMDRRVLITGDAERAGEVWFTETLGEKETIDVLRIGHHGSNTSSAAEFLDFFEEILYCVISVGEANTHGHPHPLAMNRLFNRGIVTFRTNRHGTVVALFDAQGNFAFLVVNEVPVENNLNNIPDLMIYKE